MKLRRRPFLYLLTIICTVGTGTAVALEEPAEEESTKDEKKFYKKIGPDGKVTYSDKADDSTKEIKVPKGTTYKPVKSPQFTPYQRKQKQPPPVGYSTFRIVRPVNDSTNRTNEGTLPVSIELTPVLKSGHKIVYLLDGKVVHEGDKRSVIVKEINPGTHQLTVEIRDGKDTVIQGSSSIFHQKRYLIKKK